MYAGALIKKIRKENKMNQYQLASKTGGFLNQSQISKIEKGTRKVTDIDLIRISKALDVTVDDLIPKEGK
jgi:transcriptional regulator with XRE-family HTH domain